MSSRRPENRALRADENSTMRKLVRWRTGQDKSEFLLIESVKINMPKNSVCRTEKIIRKKQKNFFKKLKKIIDKYLRK